MQIQKIKIENFKSFYEPYELNFNDVKGLWKVSGSVGSGKTTLGELLKEKYDCDVFHMDDFFLQPHQVSEERLVTPGSNVDYERFLSEVLIPMKTEKPFSYRPYVCKTQSFGKEIMIIPKDITIVEGIQGKTKSELEEYLSSHEQDFIAFKTAILLQGVKGR